MRVLVSWIVLYDPDVPRVRIYIYQVCDEEWSAAGKTITDSASGHQEPLVDVIIARCNKQ